MYLPPIRNFLWLAFLAHLISCEKEIEIDVKASELKTVVEAQLSNQQGDARVFLTETLPLNSIEEYKKVTGAEVSITAKSTHQRYALYEYSPGFYYNEDLKGIPGETYALEIILSDGSIISAEDQMPFHVSLKGVITEKMDDSFNFSKDSEDEENTYRLTPLFKDPKGINNFYQLKIYKSQKISKDVLVLKDLGFDGLENSRSVYLDAKPNENLEIYLYNISEPVFEYFRGLENVINQNSASPTNPISNLKGKALGYFSAYCTGETIDYVIPAE